MRDYEAQTNPSMKFIKRSTPVEAILCAIENGPEVIAFCEGKAEKVYDAMGEVCYRITREKGGKLLLNRAHPGDWIIKHCDGLMEVMPPDKFNAEYQEQL